MRGILRDVVRYSRVLVALGLVTALALGVFVVARASRGHGVTSVRSLAATKRDLRRLARQELHQLVVSSARLGRPKVGSVVPLPPKLGRMLPLSPSGQTCFVAAGTCSETPCVVPVRAGSDPAVAAVPATAVSARPRSKPSAARPDSTPAAVIAQPRPAISVGPAVGTVVIPNQPPLVPGRGCARRHPGPQTLRVSTG